MRTPHLQGMILPLFFAVLGLVAAGAASTAQAPASPSTRLRVFFIDVEGGQATLFVTPTGHSLLIDTGWPGNNGRDADRIAAVAHGAGLTRIDAVLITHFHTDHVGGVPQLVARIPVDTFIDHGVLRETTDPITVSGHDAYQKILALRTSKHLIVHPGEVLPVPDLRALVLSGDGDVLTQPLPGGGAPNPFCQSSATRPPDQTENARSLGVEVTFGTLKILDLGDLTWDKETQMMCPNNPLGTVDILVVSHHGWQQSSSPALVDAVHPRVAIMDNGESKGGSIPTLDTVAHSPGLETLWQLHFSKEGGPTHNTAAEFIANPAGPDAGHYLELFAAPDGSFDILNERTGVRRHYPAR